MTIIRFLVEEFYIIYKRHSTRNLDLNEYQVNISRNLKFSECKSTYKVHYTCALFVTWSCYIETTSSGSVKCDVNTNLVWITIMLQYWTVAFPQGVLQFLSHCGFRYLKFEAVVLSKTQKSCSHPCRKMKAACTVEIYAQLALRDWCTCTIYNEIKKTIF